jgi:ribulose-bisphosphate carboxylase large chain
LKYIDFVNVNYEPSNRDIVCDFSLESEEFSMEEAAGGVAAESSIGTWTELTTSKSYVEKLKATVFEIERDNCKIAYPFELFELGNMPNILSSISGNVFGLEALKSLRLNNIIFPERLIKSFKGPKYGISEIRRILNVENRPLVGTIIKPKLGLAIKDHARVAYEAWIGGCDVVKDDENLSSQLFNPFKERVIETLKMRDKAEKETNEKKAYMVNVTAETNEMLERAEFVQDNGGRYMMVDIITCGFSSLQTLVNHNLDLILHAHRAGHAAFTRFRNHGISMKVIAKIARTIGVDQLHVGTAVGKMADTRNEVKENIEALKKPMYGVRPVLPVASGGLHPRLIPDLIEIFGNDFVIQAGGGIHGHKKGTISGAIAMRQAVDSVIKGKTLEEYSKTHRELLIALDTWS